MKVIALIALSITSCVSQHPKCLVSHIEDRHVPEHAVFLWIGDEPIGTVMPERNYRVAICDKWEPAR